MKTLKRPAHTKKTLIDSAIKLMLAKGYEATSVDDICCESKLTKGSFFHHFKDKEGLAKAALDAFCCCQGEEMSKRMAKGEKDPLARIEGLIDVMSNMVEGSKDVQGCLIGNFAQELSDTHPELRKACAGKFEGLAGMIQKDLDEAKIKYKANVDTESLAYHFVAVLQGSFVVGKAKQDPRIVTKNLKHLKQYIRSLYKK
jgi:TetR/AcrR family transcriptional regulator, transcriptional repressor for nem operon